jgi:hypothetical protein
MEIRAIFTLALIVAMGSIVMVQQNATNQTGNQTNSTSISSGIYPSQDAQAKPDQTKFCADFQNDDGTTGTSCEYKSQGECKKGSIATGDEGLGCHKRDKGEEPDGGNNLSPDTDEEGSGSGPNE